MVEDEDAPAVPELVRRILLTSCHDDPVARPSCSPPWPASGVAVGDVLCDSGYAHRVPEHFALPMRWARGRAS